MSTKSGVYIFGNAKLGEHETSKPSDAMLEHKSILTGDIVSSRDGMFIDEHLAWNIEHQMQRTARKQANYFVENHRQAQVDCHRGEEAMWLRLKSTESAAEFMDMAFQLCDLYSDKRPELEHWMKGMLQDMLEDFSRIPKAVMILYLRRYAIG